MADISKIKLPDETEVNLKDAQAFANIENDGQGGSSYTITRRDGTTKQVTIPNVTTTDPGLMTASDKTKIDTIEQGAEVNQQTFSKIRITKGSAHTDLDADTKTDTLELIEGDNITLTPSAVSDSVTIHAKDTIYTLAQDATDGHIIILTNNDEGSTDHVQTITIPDNNTTYTISLNESTNEIVLTDSLGNTMKAKPSNASTSLDGFMSKNDKSKLDGIASGAEVNQNAFSNVVVDDVTISADSKTDTLTFIAGSNITITPNATNDSITIASSYTNTTYELTQDATDGHKFTLSGSNGYTKTITIPDNNTTYTLSVGTGTDANQIVFTPSSGSATKITVPYATKALQDADGNVIKDTYAASFSISGHTITLKNKSGVSLGTVTVPDNNTTYTFAEGTTNKAFSVTPSGGSAQTVPIHGLGSASEKNFTTSVTSGSADLVTSGAVASAISTAIDNLPEPMIFKGTLGTNGTITSLPTASSSNEGWTYKVITAGTYASQAAKVGDMFVSAKIGSAYQWVYVPSGDDVEDTWRNIKVNGTEKLGTGISSGAVDFVDGDFINITYANNKITVSHADTSSQASVSNSGRTYIQSVTLDGAGHVTKLTSATETVVNTDRYVNSASFADDTTASANSPVKMTLTRAGSDTATVTANIPKVSASSAGVAPKGASVSSQSQSTKFLREDGTWSAPSYTVNTDTKVTSVGNHYSPSADSSAQLSASASGGTAAWSIDVVQGVQLQRDAKGHVVGVTVTSGKIPGNPNTNYYHKTGSWNGLTYTAGKVGSPDDLVFTIPTGTSATTVALGNHTHSTTIATSTGTNQLTLSHGGKYAITTGGTSFVFTMPTDNNTDTNVTQTATNTNANYEVLFSGTADNTTRTEGARKYSNLTFNPSTGTLTTTKVVSANATLGVADIDTANITEDNVGNLIVTGAARFLNTINGSISGNAATASDSAKLNGYASDTSATNNTIARRTANGYIFATYFNQSSSAETPTSSSYMIYANSDGYFRKSTVANMKTAMSLNNVENKSSATIRGELTSANVTTALGYTPVNKAGDTMSGALHVSNAGKLIFDWTSGTDCAMFVLKDAEQYGIRYKEGNTDKMKFSASGNANTDNADLCINGAGDGTVTIRGNTILHAGNYTSYTVKKDGTGASGSWGINITGSSASCTGNAATATKLQTVRTIFNQSFDGSGNVAGQPLVYGSYNATASSRFSTSGIQVRENDLVETTQSDIAYAPAIGFHWGKRIAATLLFHSDGKFYLRKQNFTDRATLDANLTGTASNATLLNQDTTYKEGTAYVCQTSAGTIQAFCTRANNSNIGLSTTGYGCTVLSATWGGGISYNGELFMGMGDFPNLYFRGKNNGTYTAWNAIGQFTATPTSGQVVITDGTTGGMKSSGYTIAKSVPSNAVFTDTNYYHTTGSWSGLTYTATANGGAGALAFTIPTGTSATTVAVGNHTHSYAGSSSAGGDATRALKLKDKTNNNDTYLDYGSSAVTWGNITYIGAWDGYTLRAMNKNQITPANIGAAPASHSQSADTITSGYLNIQPENSPILIPFMNNDLAYMITRGGSTIVKYDGTTQSIDISGCFDAGPGYGYAIGNSGDYTSIVMELTLHQTFTWTNTIYVDFGSAGWRAKDVEIEVMNSNYSGDTWTSKYHNTSNTSGHCYVITSHTPSGASSAGGGFNKIRFTFKSFNNAIFRIAQLGVYNYGSAGLRTTYMSRGIDDAVWRSISPATTNKYNLGSSSLKWKDVYATTFYGALDGNATTATTASNLSGFENNNSSGKNANSVTYNAHTYYTSNGPVTSIGASTADGALYAQAYSTSWVGQIAQDYRDGSLFVRGKNNGTWQKWLAVLDSGNIGYNMTSTVNYDPHTRKFITSKSTSAWDAQTYSNSGYVDNVFVTFKPNQANMALMVGLDANPSQDASYGNIDYCWYVHNDAKLTMFESGTEIASISGHTTYVAGDELRVEYSGGYIRYYHNGVLCREVARAISGKLYMDSSFHGATSCIYDVEFGCTATNANYAASAEKATKDSDGNTINTTYLKKSGGTLTGAINTANGTYNNIGDDVAIGDINVAGTLGVKGLNGATGIQLVPYSGSTAQKISINGSGTMTITGTVASTFSGNLTGNVTGNVSGSSGSCTGNAATATNISSTTPTLAATIESNELTVKDLGNSAPAWGKAQRHGLDFRWYNTHWMIGNLRGESTNSVGFGFSYSSDGSTYTNKLIIDVNGGISSAGNIVGTILSVSQSNGTSGGISLYKDANYVLNYGIAFRTTANQGKHGYVQSDWATYFTMDGADTRGWVFRNAASGNVASISSAGNMVLNGSLTLGGNVGNNSGMRLVWNSSTSSLDFVVA